MKIIVIGRKSRPWPLATARTIEQRDQHYQTNECTQTRKLQTHHIKHWADGGISSVDNGVCLCESCHTNVHEGEHAIQNVTGEVKRLNAQLAQQQYAGDKHLISMESELHNR